MFKGKQIGFNFHKNRLVEPHESTIAIFKVKFVILVSHSTAWSISKAKTGYTIKNSNRALLNKCSFAWLSLDFSAQIQYDSLTSPDSGICLLYMFNSFPPIQIIRKILNFNLSSSGIILIDSIFTVWEIDHRSTSLYINGRPPFESW